MHVYDFSTFGIIACSPAGLVAGTNGHLLVGCSGTTGSIILDPLATGGNGSVKVIPQVTGSDEVAFDSTNSLYFLVARDNPGGPLLGIIDGLTDSLLQNLPTTPGDHSVAVDPIIGEVFVPFGGIPGNIECADGCIAVFAPVSAPVPEPMLTALVALAGLTWWRSTAVGSLRYMFFRGHIAISPPSSTNLRTAKMNRYSVPHCEPAESVMCAAEGVQGPSCGRSRRIIPSTLVST